MTGQDAKAAMYDLEKIHPTKVEYEREVRDALLDYELRCKDVADEKRLKFTQSELTRLDKQFNVKVQ